MIETIDTGHIRPGNLLNSSRAEEVGAVLGYWMAVQAKRRVEVNIHSVGPVKVGDTVFVLGVAPDTHRFFAVLDRELRLLTMVTKRGTARARRPPLKDAEYMRMWADREVRRFLEIAVLNFTARDADKVAVRYRHLVSAVVHRVVVELAANGVDRSMTDIAKGACSEWLVDDLTTPEIVTIRHAMYVSLVCALKPDEAGVLISRAAFVELGMLVIDESTGARMYSNAMHSLARVVPTWWTQGAATPWGKIGSSVDLALRSLFYRQLAEQNSRDIPFTELMASTTDRMMLGTDG